MSRTAPAHASADEHPVLLVHGFASSFERNWREPGWVDLLSDEGRTVIGLDLLGHGSSPKPHDPAQYARLEESVAAALPAGGQVDAIGFSLGAELLLRVAGAYPHRFRRIVTAGVGANLFALEDPVAAAGAVDAGSAGESYTGVAEALARFASSPGNDPLALAACLRRPRKSLTAAELGRITLPVLVVLGDRDFAGPPEPLVEALPDATLVVLHGCDHFATPRDFRFVDAALAFLRKG
jgi:pimeloyl-ACP methyl ester carboxylesterase